MRLLWCIALVAVCIDAAQAQTTEVLLNLQADRVYADQLGNVYTTKGTRLEKHKYDGTALGAFDRQSLGHIDYVDVSDPLKVVLFYRELTQVVVLNSMLGLQNQVIALEEHGFEQAIGVGWSHNNHLWIYDLEQFQLSRVNERMERVEQTGNLYQLLGVMPRPLQIKEVSNRVYLNDSTLGILVFDIYGGYSKTVPIKGVSDFYVEEQRISYLKNDSVCIYDPLAPKDVCHAIPSHQKQVALSKGMAYLYDGSTLTKMVLDHR